jgi:hypothetical protein
MDTLARFRASGLVAFAFIAMTVVPSAAPVSAARQTPAAQRSAAKTIDAVTLAIAVRAGQAKQYEGYVVTGEGRSFDTNCTPADPTKKIEATIPLGVGALGPDGKPMPVVTLDDWVNFQMVGRAMLMVKLRGADLKIKPEPDPANPVLYTFAARFTGQTESVTPPASILDNNPKPYTVAILVDAVAK